MLDFDHIKDCCGCGACVNVCPKSAVQLVLSPEGSYVPEIDPEKCVSCGLCERTCVHLNKLDDLKAMGAEGCYAAYQLDDEKRMKSASGGMFLPLAMEVLYWDGYVCGCVWDENMNAVHIVSNKVPDIERMCNSKYVQSDTGSCYKEIRTLLKNGKTVMFTGTPCQCAACAAVAGHPDNLLLVSLICEGTVSTGVWQRYRDAKEKQLGAKLCEINFRNKDYAGWKGPFCTMKARNGRKCKEFSFRENNYVLAMLQNKTFRDSCYHCEFKGDNGCADIVIGDMWGASERLTEKSRNKGLSALIVNTVNGEKWIEQVDHDYYKEPYPIDRVKKYNVPLTVSAKRTPGREQFFRDLDKLPIETNLSSGLKRENALVLRITKLLIVLHLYKPLKKIIKALHLKKPKH